MKTAMQELIERLEIEANSISDNDHIEDRCWRNGIRRSLNIAKGLLEKEKEQIINGHWAGWSDAYDYLKKDNNDRARQAEEQYYNQTYNQNKSFTYCQREIEGQSICDKQCEHCKEYYAPLENQNK